MNRIGWSIVRAVLCLALMSTAQAADSTSSDGTYFVIAFPVTKLESSSGRTQIVLNTKVDGTQVTVQTTDSNSNTYVISSDSPRRINVNNNRRTSDGLENNKAYVITSDNDISVAVYVQDEDGYGDVAIAQPVRSDATEFYLNAVQTGNVGDCGSEPDRTFSFIVTIAQEPDTSVTLFDLDGEVADTFSVNPFDTYTIRQTYAERNVGFTGQRMVSTKPIAVMIGNACYVAGSNSYASPYFDFVPPVSRLGLDHIIPSAISDLSAGQDHFIQTVATQGSTLVSITGVANSVILNQGEFRRDRYNADQSIVIKCDKPCSVTLTTTNLGAAYMAHIPPLSRLNQEVVFTFPTASGDEIFSRKLSLVATSNQYSFLFLNGNSLDLLTWVCGSDALQFYCYTEMDINQGTYQLISTRPEIISFTAIAQATFLDSTEVYEGKGYGFNLGFFAELPLDSAPQPPDTVVSEGQPEYNVQHRASFSSADGSDIPDGCDADYQAAMVIRAGEMEDMVNFLVGNGSFCQVPAVFGAVGLLNTTGVTVTVATSDGTLTFDWRVQGASSLSIEQIESCGADIGAYLAPFDNWGTILPPVSGCPDVDFTGDTFDPLGNTWDCPAATTTRSPTLRTDELRLEMTLSGGFSTNNGNNINATCGQLYSQEFDDSSFQVTVTVSNLLNSGQLCDGRFVPIQSSLANVNIDESEAATVHNVVFNPPSNLPFVEIQNCVDEVSAYMEDQRNWPEPIIERPGDCPAITFNSNSFVETNRVWRCVSAASENKVFTSSLSGKRPRAHKIDTKAPEAPVFTQPKAFLDHVKAKQEQERAGHQKNDARVKKAHKVAPKGRRMKTKKTRNLQRQQ